MNLERRVLSILQSLPIIYQSNILKIYQELLLATFASATRRSWKKNPVFWSLDYFLRWVAREKKYATRLMDPLTMKPRAISQNRGPKVVISRVVFFSRGGSMSKIFATRQYIKLNSLYKRLCHFFIKLFFKIFLDFGKVFFINLIC